MTTAKRATSDASTHTDRPITVREAAELLGCSPSLVYKLMSLGELSYEKRGKRKLPVRQSIEDYRRRNLVTAKKDDPQKAIPRKDGRFRHLFQ